MPDRKDRVPTIAWYGDDFTGAAAVMEALTFGGLPSVLFLSLPTPEQLFRFRHYGGIGLAGTSRSKSPLWMDQHLPDVFAFLDKLEADIVQYKVCSTFDSSPDVGSIGHAYDLAAPVFPGAWVPLVVAAPPVHRYQAFGNLFAAVGGQAYRLDRHPTMSRHPVTPMEEADLRLHLARQTAASIGLIDLVAMHAGLGQAALENCLKGGVRIVAIDIVDDCTLREAGRLVWENRGTHERLFAIGSQGLEYALLRHWHGVGLVDPPDETARVAKVDRVVAVSGSCSPVTAEQIDHAEINGFRPLRLDVTKAIGSMEEWSREKQRAISAALSILAAGLDPLIFTARGPDDPAVREQNKAIEAHRADASAVNLRIGEGLGEILASVLGEGHVKRAIVAGGDTSGHVMAGLGVYALTALAPTVAGAALFQAHSESGVRDLEVALKGGQMGTPDYFSLMRGGV